MEAVVTQTQGPTLERSSKFSRRLLTVLALAAIVVLYACVGALLAFFAYRSGDYKDGVDTMFYVHRGELLYRSITQDGNWFPLIDMSWYNGVQTWRYWSPLSAYILAGCQALAGGSSDLGFLVFIALSYFLCAIVWLVIGCTHKRPWMGAVLGLFWFMIPNNAFMFFGEGVLARAITLPALPVFFVALYDYLFERKWSGLPWMIGSFLFIICCHVGWAGMVAISTLFVLLFYFAVFLKDKPASAGPVVVAILLAFLLSGPLLYPSLKGGITGIDSSAVMAHYFQSLLDSINPLLGLPHGEWNRWLWVEAPYFGLATLALCVLGVLCAKRKSLPGFWAALLILLMSTPTAYHLLVYLPGSQYLWMTRFMSIAVCLVLVSFFFWRSLKRPFQTTFLLLFGVQTLLALALVTHAQYPSPPNDYFDSLETAMLIDQGKEITHQRMSIIDPYDADINGVYVVAGYGEDRKPTSFGQGVQAAPIYSNLVQINQAAETEQYLYLFDRCLELGNDTLIMPLNMGGRDRQRDRAELLSAANRVGYRLVAENPSYQLYHIDAPDAFGVVSHYHAIAIGTGSSSIALGFPAVEETSDIYLDDYTYEKLSQYDVIYLAGFMYHNREAAEELVLKLSEAGKRVLIMADGIPADEHTGSKTFLGVSCNTVNFQNGYPALDTIDGVLYCDLFPEGYSKDWKTVYLNGLDDVWGTITDVPEGKMDFFGTAKNDNVVFIGLALTYHYSLTLDPAVGQLLSHALTLSATELPQRELVPISVDYRDNVITIDSPRDDVNTTLAFHDIFDADRELEAVNNLTVVDEGRTVIHLHYPYLAIGLTMLGLGLVLTVGYLILMKRRFKELDQWALDQEANAKAEAERMRRGRIWAAKQVIYRKEDEEIARQEAEAKTAKLQAEAQREAEEAAQASKEDGDDPSGGQP